jgi:hypothetical protein
MSPDETPQDAVEPHEGEEDILALVRYGLGKEIRLFPTALVFVEREEGEATRYDLDSIRRLSLQPGERIPSKLILIVELTDGAAIIAGEGMTNVRDFRRLLPLLTERAPHIELDPPDMDTQLAQAMTNRRQMSLGCYGVFLALLLLLVLACVLGNLLHHG